MEILGEIRESVINGDNEAVSRLVTQALDEGIPADALLNTALIPSMDEVGRLFEEQEFFVPEMLIAARAMQSGLSIIKPILADSGLKSKGQIALGTVKGDLHDVGKNLVGMMMEGAGIEVVDLGVDVPTEQFVEAAQEGADLIGMSALLTTTMLSMREVIEALEETGMRDHVKVLVRGAPLTPEFAQSIGADGFAPSASSAVVVSKKLLKS